MKDPRVGKQIKTLIDLQTASLLKMSVFSPRQNCMFAKPKPAAFAINMAGSVLLREISAGLFVYIKPKH
jgi:hypothetical protein